MVIIISFIKHLFDIDQHHEKTNTVHFSMSGFMLVTLLGPIFVVALCGSQIAGQSVKNQSPGIPSEVSTISRSITLQGTDLRLMGL